MSSSLREYIIPFKGLKNGVHKYNFEIDRAFFAHFEMSKIKEAQLSVELIFDKRDTIMDLHFSCTGTFQAQCDRCLAEISLPLSFNDHLVVKVSENEVDEEEFLIVDPKESHLDLSTDIYEMIHVHLPISNTRDCEATAFEGCDPAYQKFMSNQQKELGINNPMTDLLKNLSIND